MALANLKKLSQRVSSNSVTMDEFIDGASRYALGQADVVPIHGTKDLVVEDDTVIKRATFTLSDSAIKKLNELSEKTGIAKSRLIRIWLADSDTFEIDRFLSSQTK